MPDYVRLTYHHSSIGNSYHQKRTIRALGFRKLHQSRVVPNTPSLRGMLRSVAHLVAVEPAEAVFPEILNAAEKAVEKEMEQNA